MTEARPLRILQLVTYRQFRGAEIFAANLSTELIRHGHQVWFVGLYAPGPNVLSVPGAYEHDLYVKRVSWVSLRGVWRLARLIRLVRPDVIQANGSDTLKYLWLARWLAPRTPLLYRNISLVSVWMGRSFFKRAVYRWLFSQIDFVTSVGPRTRDDFIACLRYPPEKIEVIPRGIPPLHPDAAVRARWVAQGWVNAGDFVVVHMGHFSPEKNHLFLLDVWSRVVAADPWCRLLLAGEGALRDTIEHEVKDRQLENSVRLVGFQPAAQILPGADLVALCSLVEGVPGVILEAASAGVACIAVDVGGVSEVVIPEQTGVLLPAHDATLFAESILRLKRHPAERLALGARARQQVSDTYDPEKNAGRFISRYRQLMLTDHA